MQRTRKWWRSLSSHCGLPDVSRRFKTFQDVSRSISAISSAEHNQYQFQVKSSHSETRPKQKYYEILKYTELKTTAYPAFLQLKHFSQVIFLQLKHFSRVINTPSLEGSWIILSSYYCRIAEDTDQRYKVLRILVVYAPRRHKPLGKNAQKHA